MYFNTAFLTIYTPLGFTCLYISTFNKCCNMLKIHTKAVDVSIDMEGELLTFYCLVGKGEEGK